MGVKHLMVSESKSKCGRLVTQGTGADCKNCARVADAEAKWSAKPAADMVAVATDVPGEPEYMTREDYATKVAEATKPRAKSAKITKVAVSVEPSEDLGDAAEANAQAWCEAGSPRDEAGRPIVPGVESAPIISEGDTVYRDRDGAQGVVSAITVNGELVVDFTSGAQVTTSVEELARNCYEVISAAEVQAGEQAAQATVAIIDPAAREAFELAKIDAVERGYFGERAPVLIESYAADFAARLDDDLIADGTLGDFCRCHHGVTKPVMPAAIKQPIRTCMGRRKRKATKRARKQAHGMKGGK